MGPPRDRTPQEWIFRLRLTKCPWQRWPVTLNGCGPTSVCLSPGNVILSNKRFDFLFLNDFFFFWRNCFLKKLRIRHRECTIVAMVGSPDPRPSFNLPDQNLVWHGDFRCLPDLECAVRRATMNLEAWKLELWSIRWNSFLFYRRLIYDGWHFQG